MEKTLVRRDEIEKWANTNLERLKSAVKSYGQDLSWECELTEEEQLEVLTLIPSDVVSITKKWDSCEMCGSHGISIITLSNGNTYYGEEW